MCVCQSKSINLLECSKTNFLFHTIDGRLSIDTLNQNRMSTHPQFLFNVANTFPKAIVKLTSVDLLIRQERFQQTFQVSLHRNLQ